VDKTGARAGMIYSRQTFCHANLERTLGKRRLRAALTQRSDLAIIRDSGLSVLGARPGASALPLLSAHAQTNSYSNHLVS